MKAKRKIHRTNDPTWSTHTYGSSETPYNVEWVKYYNPAEGKEQIIFLYSSKDTKKIEKYRVL